MEQLVVRRWIGASPERVWPHVVDLAELALTDPELDLEVQHGEGQPSVGMGGVVTRRQGHRVLRTELRIVDVDPPRHALLTVDASNGERWLLTIELHAMAGDTGVGTDLILRARRDERRRRLPSLASQRVATELTTVLEGLSRASARGARPDPVAA